MVDVNPRIRLKVNVTSSDIMSMTANFENLSKQDIIAIVQKVLSDTYLALMSDLTLWIRTYVPRRTGQLQDNLIANMKSSNVTGMRLNIYLGTGIGYAKYVEEMPTSEVAHAGVPAYAYYYGFHGKMILMDPQAIGHFFTNLLAYAYKQLQFRLKSTIAIVSKWYSMNKTNLQQGIGMIQQKNMGAAGTG